MNDRFKFRVWNEKHRKYIQDNEYPIGGDYSLSMTQYGYVEVIGLGDYQDYSDDIHSWGVVKNLEDYIGDCVVEQCTGLKDKNGKLIYEGDILRSESYPFKSDNEYHYAAEVCFDEESAVFFYYIFRTSTKVAGRAEGNTGQLNECDWEIIGNIHENADLLENEK